MNKGILLIAFALLGLSYGVKIDYIVPNCSLATIEATADVQIGGKPVTLKNNNTVSGTCDATSSSMQIGLGTDGSSLTLYFSAANGFSTLASMAVSFKDGTNTLKAKADVNTQLSTTDAWYVCDDPETYELTGDQSVTVTIESIKVQAFGVVDGKYSPKNVSCQAAGNDTTTVKPTSTTQPSTLKPTTAKPSTAEPTSSTTKKATTPAAPTTKPRTTRPPAPTAAPAPKHAKPVVVSVNDTNTVCLLLNFTGTLSVDYVNTTGANNTYIYPIDGLKRQDGDCGDEKEVVELTLRNNWILTFKFFKTKAKKASRRLLADGTYYMGELELVYDQGDIPGNKKTGVKIVGINSTNRFETNVGSGFSCKSEEVIKMPTASFSTIDFKAEAFRTSKTAEFSKNPTVCSADFTPPSNIVPIVVGVVLALLVLVIIVAYLIGRRRAQSGYQSV